MITAELLIFLLLDITIGPCLLKLITLFVNQRVDSVKLLVLRKEYEPLPQDEFTI